MGYEQLQPGLSGETEISDPVPNAALVVTHPVPHLEHQQPPLAALGKFECRVQSVRRLLIVVEHEMSADRAYLRGMLDA